MNNVLKKQPSILIIIALIGFPQISESIFTPILPALSSGMHVSAQKTQLTMSTYFLMFAFGVLFFGWLSDKHGRKPAMLFGLAIYLLGNIGLLYTENFSYILVFRMVQAFGASAGSVITQTIMRESFYGIEGEKVFAKVGAALALSPALGPLIGGYLQSSYGYRSVFATLVSMAVALLLYTGVRLPETRNVDTIEKHVSWIVAIKELAKSSKVWGYAVLISGVNGILFSYYAEAPFVFIKGFQLSTVQYGWTGLIIAGAILSGSIITNFLANILTGFQLIEISLVVSLLGVLVMFCGANRHLNLMFVSILFVFIGLNMMLPIVLSQALIGFEHIIGLASGIFSFAYYMLISALTYLMTIMHNGSLFALPTYVLILLMAMTLSLILIKDRK
ncbi:major facilitator superfamily transporter permease [Weissella kandleri]|uniref:Bcr/CflA family efflux transporter n=1 Tax=Weissella kandleri TaxID=1616 RepID=A0A0R2JNA2_9LACO|nr:multidrug effflux MFS transporter [Weissella kandleri]KRN75588.1 major facilitator superfamily transporter permease [Weissella kandleri]